MTCATAKGDVAGSVGNQLARLIAVVCAGGERSGRGRKRAGCRRCLYPFDEAVGASAVGSPTADP